MTESAAEGSAVRRAYEEPPPRNSSSNSLASSSSGGSRCTQKIDRFGFLALDDGSNEEDLSGEEEQIRRCERALSCTDPKRWRSKSRRIVFAGIPDTMRSALWLRLLELERAKLDFYLAGRNRSSCCCVAERAVARTEQTQQMLAVAGFYEKACGFERQIDLDVARTFRDHVLFSQRHAAGQQRLFRILVAFSNVHPEIGYCQGMNLVAASLLIYYEEHRAFNLLLHLVRHRSLGRLYSSGFPLLFELLAMQELLLKKHAPRVLARLQALQIAGSVYAAKWYLSLFLCFPFAVAMRLWDLFMCLGCNVLACFAAAVLCVQQKTLLSAPYDALLEFLSGTEKMPLAADALFDCTRRIYEKALQSRKSGFEAMGKAAPA